MEEKYLDQIKKAEFFREQILKEYLKVGRGVDSETIDKHVKQLETRTAILSQISIEDGSDFDIEQINRTLFYLYNDLRILYEIIVEHKKNRFMLLKEELDFKLQSLETIANEYKNKAEQSRLREESKLYSFKADPIRFPGGLKRCIEEINKYGVQVGM